MVVRGEFESKPRLNQAQTKGKPLPDFCMGGVRLFRLHLDGAGAACSLPVVNVDVWAAIAATLGPMDKKNVLIKSELGRDAIARRLPELPARLRPLLIMVDGKRTVAELEKLAEAMGGMAAIEQLQTLAMVEVVTGGALAATAATVAPATVSAPTEATPADGAGALSLPEFREQLAVYFEAQLGPSATMLGIQIRACTKLADLKPLVARGLDNLKHFKGAVAVKAYEQGLGAQMPKA